MKPLYYELHIEIEPDGRGAVLVALCSEHGFKYTGELDTKQIATKHGQDYDALYKDMEYFVERLKQKEFEPIRQKIEAVVYDVRN